MATPAVMGEWHPRYGVMCGLKYVLATASARVEMDATSSRGIAGNAAIARGAIRVGTACMTDSHDDVQVRAAFASEYLYVHACERERE
jgi:hypothetical protein